MFVSERDINRVPRLMIEIVIAGGTVIGARREPG